MSFRRSLGRGRLFSVLGLLVLLAACLTISWSTDDPTVPVTFLRGQVAVRSPATTKKPLVDLSSWQTARRLNELAGTGEEAEYGGEAERLADHGVDQEFASAMRQARPQHHSLSGDALSLSHKVTSLQQIVRQDQERLNKLEVSKRSLSSTTDPALTTSIADDLDLTKAQLGLDSDELTDAQQDLARTVGDTSESIQQQLTAHESEMRKYETASAQRRSEVVSAQEAYGTIAHRLRVWMDQRSRYQMVRRAMQEAHSAALILISQHDQLERQADAESASPAERSSTSAVPRDKASQLDALESRTAQRQLLSIYDDRIQTQQQLAAVYDKWSRQLLLQHGIVSDALLRSFALVAFILICVILFDALVRHLVKRPSLDRRSMQKLRIICKVGVQCLAGVLLLLLVFGAPRQMPTILGLTTAGLTVTLQDFIIAFFGWFVLMGKNGMRLGDWVEINSVGGEVIQIGLFRTALLETGNWTDQGRPTGRRVTFVNSFAIKGQYFNFSTASQWMWDEIRVSIPTADDPYSIIELIQKEVLEETQGDALLAEEEWKRVTRQNGLSQFTARTAVDMRPGAAGIDIIVRYITRASERFEVRNRLYQCVIDLLHKPLTPRPNQEKSQSRVALLQQQRG